MTAQSFLPELLLRVTPCGSESRPICPRGVFPKGCSAPIMVISLGRSSDFGLRTSNFELRISDLGPQASGRSSDFRNSELRTSNFELRLSVRVKLAALRDRIKSATYCSTTTQANILQPVRDSLSICSIQWLCISSVIIFNIIC